MARIRSIKPEFPQSETIGKLSRDARLLFIQIWTLVDDEGRCRAASRMLASLLYPYDDDAPGLIGAWLQELEDNGAVRRYMVDGSVYLEVSNWLKHQKIDRPSASKLPPFSEPSRALASPREEASTDLGSRIKDLGSRKEAKPSDSSSPAAPQFGRADFERIETACIRALGQDSAPADAVIGPIVLLVQNGASLENITTILISEAKRPRKKPIRTWALWAEIVAEKLADAARPPPSPRANGAVSEIHVAPALPVITDEIWRMYLGKYTPGNGAWLRPVMGPPPDEPGCRAPAAMVAEWDARFPDRFRFPTRSAPE